jgi:glycosyltransferase involved in cell wall biosynthesis
MKGGAFDITLLMPGTPDDRAVHASQIESVCDRAVLWRSARPAGQSARLRRALSVLGALPVSVASDRDREGARTVLAALEEKPDVVVFDFPHSAVLAPARIGVPSVMFTHNVEAEIFRRHAEVAHGAFMKALWRSQYRKMCAFERRVLAAFDGVVAVSERDREFFRREWGIEHGRPIPTGVDTEFFAYAPPGDAPEVVFCGSMDWMPNIDAVEFFHESVWPLIREKVPGARMKVIGRTPPSALVRRIGAASPEWQFTGFVDDVRDHVRGATAFVIPLRIGGGTRIKAYEAMAMGAPIVSTTIGVEGLPLTDGRHYLNGDEPGELARGVVALLTDAALRRRVSADARELVEREYGFRRAAAVFEQICLDTVERRRSDSRA